MRSLPLCDETAWCVFDENRLCSSGEGRKYVDIVTGSVPVGVYHHLNYPGERLHVLSYSLYTFVNFLCVKPPPSLLHDLKLELIACSILRSKSC